jgi:hypothetical protein
MASSFAQENSMSCILRVSGDELNVDALLRVVGLQPDRVWRRGEPRRASKPDGKRNESSGVTFVASDADYREFSLQLDEATEFLEDNRAQIAAMASFEGVQHAILDFGIELRDVPFHSDILTPQFLMAVAGMGLAVELSHYPCRAEDQQSEQVVPPNGCGGGLSP